MIVNHEAVWNGGIKLRKFNLYGVILIESVWDFTFIFMITV